MTRGYLTFAQNTDTVDYLNLAYVQALSIKATQEVNSYTVVVDANTLAKVTDRHRKVFDHVIPMPGTDASANDSWKLKNEWKAMISSPYDQTVKVESDMLFTSSVDHWWDIMAQLDMCFTVNIVDFRGKVSKDRSYRKVFDLNQLPNIYNGFYFFKKNQNSEKFFNYARAIYEQWDFIREEVLVGTADQDPTTDLVFALAANLCDFNCYLPTQTIPCFAHMKGAINGWSVSDDWRNKVYYQFDKTYLTIGATRQTVPFHYHYKNFINEDIIRHYETLVR
jgi:hypothetical protein